MPIDQADSSGESINVNAKLEAIKRAEKAEKDKATRDIASIYRQLISENEFDNVVQVDFNQIKNLIQDGYRIVEPIYSEEGGKLIGFSLASRYLHPLEEGGKPKEFRLVNSVLELKGGEYTNADDDIANQIIKEFEASLNNADMLRGLDNLGRELEVSLESEGGEVERPFLDYNEAKNNLKELIKNPALQIAIDEMSPDVKYDVLEVTSAFESIFNEAARQKSAGEEVDLSLLIDDYGLRDFKEMLSGTIVKTDSPVKRYHDALFALYDAKLADD